MKLMSMKLMSMKSMAVAGCLVALNGCGSSDSGDSDDNQLTGQSVEQTISLWAPVRMEQYMADGELFSCTTNTLDSDNYVMNSFSSTPSGDPDYTLQCNESDTHTTLTEFTYNTDRTHFTTLSQSSYDPSASCTSVTLSTKNIPIIIDTYLSASSNYVCSPDTGTLFTRQMNTLTNSLYIENSTIYNSPGQDSVWGTNDDIISIQYINNWSVDYLYQESLVYYGPGTDGIWNTADDLATSSVETFYLESMVPSHIISTSAGMDMVLGTNDDFITSYMIFTYEDGLVKDYTSYLSPGIDGLWETTEDNYKQFTVFY